MQTKAATRYRHTLCWPNFTSPDHHLSSHLCFHLSFDGGIPLCPMHTARMSAGLMPTESRSTGDTAGTLVALTLCALVQVPACHWCVGEMLSPGYHHSEGLLPQLLPGLDERPGKSRCQRHSQHFSFPTLSWLNGCMQKEAET